MICSSDRCLADGRRNRTAVRTETWTSSLRLAASSVWKADVGAATGLEGSDRRASRANPLDPFSRFPPPPHRPPHFVSTRHCCISTSNSHSQWGQFSHPLACPLRSPADVPSATAPSLFVSPARACITSSRSSSRSSPSPALRRPSIAPPAVAAIHRADDLFFVRSPPLLVRSLQGVGGDEHQHQRAEDILVVLLSRRRQLPHRDHPRLALVLGRSVVWSRKSRSRALSKRELRPNHKPTSPYFSLPSSPFFGAKVLLFGGLNAFVFRALPVIVVSAVFGCWFFGTYRNKLTSAENHR